MLKIAFCDDDPSVLNTLGTLLDKYRAERNQGISYTSFQSPLELLAEIERGTRYDIAFLDVLMPGATGINAAAEIRNYDRNVKIIFLTSSTEFAVQSYTVGAYFYQLKPILEDSFFRLLDSAIDACEKERSDSLILRCKDGITRVELRNLEYCEVIRHSLFIHLSGGTVLESVGSLEKLWASLELYPGFVRPHRSYIVNLEYVQALSYRSVKMASQAEIPIPRGKYQELKDQYLEYAFQSRQVML